MKYFICIVLLAFTFFIGAVSHEKDMARNFKKTGDAKAWFFDIKHFGGNNDKKPSHRMD